MHRLGDLLGTIPLPRVDLDAAPPQEDCLGADLVHDLGADLPEAHVHLWGGPAGAGKSAFLLSLLHAAARRGRGVVYATYDLPAPSLALRLLAMCAGVEAERIPDPGAGGGHARGADLAAGEARCLERTRRDLADLPFFVLEARGFGLRALGDRLVRLTPRPSVLALDYLQAVVRPSGQDAEATVHELVGLARRLHLACICSVRATDATDREIAVDDWSGPLPDRVGWIKGGETPEERRAEVLLNRHGARPALKLRVDPASGAVARASEA